MIRRGRARRGVSTLLAVLIVATQVMALGAVPAIACDRAQNADVISHLGGSGINRVAFGGTHAYAAADGALIVFDVSDHTAPKPVAQVPLHGKAEDVAVAGGFAYVVGDWGEMQIVDVTDPAAPVMRGSIGWGGAMHGVAVSGDRVWVTSDGHGFKCIDVTDKDEPSLSGYAGEPDGHYYDVALVGTKAYVSWGSEPGRVTHVRAFSVANATPAKLGGDYTVTGTNVSIASVAASGTTLFLAEAARGLETVDFHAPSAPVQLGTFGTPGANGFDVALDGKTAYLAAGEAGLRVLDVTDPAAPSQLGFSASAGFTLTSVAAAGSHVYGGGQVYQTGRGFHVFDVSAPGTPNKTGSFRLLPADARSVTASGDFAYVPSGAEGLLKVDIKDPSAPKLVGAFTGASDAAKIAVREGVGYLADGPTLRVLDLTPAYPAQLSNLTLGAADIEDVSLDYPRLYVAQGEAGLRVLDVSDAAHPVLLGTFAGADLGPVHSVAGKGERVYIGVNGGNVVSVDASDPAHMTELDRMGTYGDVISLSLDGETLWAGTTMKVYRIDASDPADVFQVGNYFWIGSSIVSVVGDGAYAYAAAEDGFHLIDFSDAANPYEATSFGAESLPMGGVSLTADGRVFLAARSAGLYEIAVPVLRTSGKNRFETAVELSKANWTSAPTVVLASGMTFADAACAAPLAHALGGPLLLTRDTISDAALEEIARLGADHVVIIGSEVRVPKKVVDALVAAGIPESNIKRLGGWNRYDTARLVAHELKLAVQAKGSTVTTAFVATGDKFADALSVSGVAGQLDAPVLLVKKSSVPTPTAAAIEDLGHPALVAVGGTPSISDQVYDQLGCVDRLWGDDRYETARKIADYSIDHDVFEPSGIIVASGQDFPDALVSGVVSAQHANPILLTSGTLPPSSAGFISDHADTIDDVTVVGSAFSVSKGVEDEIVDLLGYR